jgi:hypothetical protein
MPFLSMNVKAGILCAGVMLASLHINAQGDKDRLVKKDPAGKVNVAPQLIRGPYLQVATTNSIVIRWRTDASARSRVGYGATPALLDNTAADSVLTTEHLVKLTGLTPNTRYYYSIGGMKDVLQGDSSNYFYTLPVAGTEGVYRIGAFGDCGNNSVNQRNVRNAFVKYLGDQYLNAWILLGDNSYPDGADAELQAKFFNIYKDDLLKKYPLFPAPGNHDYHDIEFSTEVAQRTHEVAYYQNFSMPLDGEAGGVPSHTKAFYSYDIGNVHFLSLDSYGKEGGDFRMYDTLGPQVQWVKKDLSANKNKQWVVAYWHHPPYTMGSHSSDGVGELAKIRQNFIQILERYGVDLVLCGHSHDYERSSLMKGHYGPEATFNAAEHNLSNSSGRYDGAGNCPYIKESGSNQGTVYVVSGSAGQLGGRSAGFPHNAMQYANDSVGGASIIEVRGNRLDLKWICSDGAIRDHFVMMKDVNKNQIIPAKKGEQVTLTASFVGDYSWLKRKDTTRSITVTATGKKTVYEVIDPYTCLKDRFEIQAQ